MSVITARQYTDSLARAERRKMWLTEATRFALMMLVCLVIVSGLCAAGVCK